MSDEPTTYDPGEHTVDEVKEYVTANPDQADEVLAAEQAGQNRVTLVSWLEAQTASGPEQQSAPEQQTGEGEETEVEPEAAEAEPEMTLPQALADIGLVGMRALVSGTYTGPSGATYWLSPGVAIATSPEDASALASLCLVLTDTPV